MIGSQLSSILPGLLMTSRIGHVGLGTWRRSPPRPRCHLCVGELSIQDAAPANWSDDVLPPSRRDRRARRRRALGGGSRDVGVPTKRNSAIASNGARTVKMSERALKSLRDHGPSKLKVPGSSPGGVANVYNGLDVRQGSGPLPAGVKLFTRFLHYASFPLPCNRASSTFWTAPRRLVHRLGGELGRLEKALDDLLAFRAPGPPVPLSRSPPRIQCQALRHRRGRRTHVIPSFPVRPSA